MNQQPESPDARIDHVLNALRETEVPTGLEDRILNRLAKGTQAHDATTSHFGVMLNAVKDFHIPLVGARLYTFAATSLTLLLALWLFIFQTHHPASTQPIASVTGIQTQSPAQRSDASSRNHIASNTVIPYKGSGPWSRRTSSTPNVALAAEGDASRSSRKEFQTATLTPASTSATDPDAVALAETLTPSHPAPPLPLTPQERLLLSAAQKGAPIELAELERIHEPELRAAAEAREEAGLQRFAQGVLAPLAISESLDPTPQDDAPPTPAPESLPPSTN